MFPVKVRSVKKSFSLVAFSLLLGALAISQAVRPQLRAEQPPEFDGRSAPGLSVKELSENVPHGQFGVTTVGEVRAAGGDVIPTSGRSESHATLTALSPETASALLNPTIRNPNR